MTVNRDKTGRWRYRAMVLRRDGEKVRISGSAPRQINTRAAALQAERDHILREQGRVDEVRTAVRFKDFAEEFMSTYALSNNKASVQDSKRKILDLHLLPAFGEMDVSEIRIREIEALKAKLLVGRSRKTVNTIMNVLSKLLTYAVDVEVIEKAPKVKMLKVDEQPFRFLDFDEYEQLYTTVRPEPDWLVAILLGGDAGLRLGEIRALRWDHVDRKAGRLTVKKAFWKGIEGATKGWSHRAIPLTDRLVEALEMAKHGRGPYIVCRPDGKFRSLDAMLRNMNRLRALAGVGAMQWHALRHTFCSHLALKGAPVRVIQELAGHASITTTMRYMHLVPGATEAAIKLLNGKPPPKE